MLDTRFQMCTNLLVSLNLIAQVAGTMEGLHFLSSFWIPFSPF
ncbi:hypothetical protein SLEP1_g54406 [Rubroshorea leprosula]|uniref:Uncharacterized protein n=1 Tax=Rubroshorea leprosula TaxID=152421 RepID=A0AAV5MD82_9ROSI|nr:hypothetical protein SLEP1_g54406 [Rubroshorea leprosula]